MKSRAFLGVPLASLFASLLSGCPDYGSCGDGDGTPKIDTHIIELTRDEYAQWSMGTPPGSTVGDPTTGGGSSTGGSSTGGSSTGGSTTGGSTTGGSSTGGEMLTEQQTCELVCSHFSLATKTCSVAEFPSRFAVRCDVRVTSNHGCIKGGRLHPCVTSRGATAGPDAAAWLASAAHDEAASVHAFRSLGRELKALGAPPELLAGIEAAALDEVRHAKVVSALALRGGAEVPALEVVEVPVRDLLAIAVENAVEGCVHETWAALTAAHQARFAEDLRVREIYTVIAADEARHAELAWAIDAWLSSQLDAEGRAEVARARRIAAEALAGRIAATGDSPRLAVLGLPPTLEATRLCAGLDGALWSQAA